MKISIYILSVFIVFGCKKISIKKDFPSLKGDYEWVYSVSGAENSIGVDSNTDRFAIRVEGNGNVIFIKNSVKISKLCTTEVFEKNEGVYIVKLEEKEEIIFIEVADLELTNSTYPYKSFKNHFIKK